MNDLTHDGKSDKIALFAHACKIAVISLTASTYY